MSQGQGFEAASIHECEHRWVLPWRPQGYTNEEVFLLSYCLHCGRYRVPRDWDDWGAQSPTDPEPPAR